MNTAEGIRINKYLSEMGICSRREADRLVEAGRVFINGKPAVAGQRVEKGDRVLAAGKIVDPEERTDPVVLAFHKPRGIVCTASKADRAENIIDFLNLDYRVFPVGRLDKESRGLILLTNRGELVNRINKSRYGHEKEYVVTVRHGIDETFLDSIRKGVEITLPVIDASEKDAVSARGREYVKVTTLPCRAEKLGDRQFDVVLTQGLNRQIRRMCDALGNYVVDLKRIRVMNVELGTLAEGEYRVLEGAELETLLNML